MSNKPTIGKKGVWSKKIEFHFREHQEASGAHTGFTTSKAEADTPTATFSDVNADTIKS